ncbi:cold-shock protein [Paenimyroides baculatum]|uniref:Cold shock domain-containing protein n=1 Tax=Paenimyroides baculatum TaxID=2608000 RepID=A0A5M6CDA7_9FLAO|nr:cold shock domain-containing protein [Paenimyroides baculatum]KAA5531812.1 cold shock domain-containing protein [Paenimyroides baculatum]
MKEGKVKFFNESKGFGFIVNNNNSEDVFVHATGLIDQVAQNDDVIFDIERGKKGFVAVNVKRR